MVYVEECFSYNALGIVLVAICPSSAGDLSRYKHPARTASVKDVRYAIVEVLELLMRLELSMTDRVLLLYRQTSCMLGLMKIDNSIYKQSMTMICTQGTEQCIV